MTPLHLAAACQQTELVKLLLADPRTDTTAKTEGQTPKEFANSVEGCSAEIRDLLN